MLADQCAELRVVTDAVHGSVKVDGLERAAHGSVGARGELDGLVPIDVGGQGLFEERDGFVVGGVEGFDRVLGDLFEGGLGDARDALGPAEFDGYDVM